MDISRRDFVKALSATPIAGVSDVGGSVPYNGSAHPCVGKPLPPWKPGEFQVHFIYTGAAESMFWIMPDGTTMLLDCGDHAAYTRGKKALWLLPSGSRNSGEWIARYVTRVNPAKTDVDYMMISHHHADHVGCEGWGGFLQAADTLKFRKCFDRGWPNFNDPIPDERCDAYCYRYVRKTIDTLVKRDGMEMVKFDVGAVNQVAMLKDAASHRGFKIVNITGNGKILCRDGSIRNLYADRLGAKGLNENGMSLGVIVQYGPFRFYSAGDFSDGWRLPDNSLLSTESELAKELDPVDVAKVNHHGHHSMPTPIVSALRASVWTACVWDALHMTADTLTRLSDRNAYPGPRLVATQLFSPLRRIEDAGKPFLADIAPEAFDAGHVVLTAAPGGMTYNIAYVTVDDESMNVTGAYDFVSRSV